MSPAWGWGSGDDVAGGKASDCVEDAGAASGALDCTAGADPPAEGEGDCGLVCTLRTGPDSAGGAVTVR